MLLNRFCTYRPKSQQILNWCVHISTGRSVQTVSARARRRNEIQRSNPFSIKHRPKMMREMKKRRRKLSIRMLIVVEWQRIRVQRWAQIKQLTTPTINSKLPIPPATLIVMTCVKLWTRQDFSLTLVYNEQCIICSYKTPKLIAYLLVINVLQRKCYWKSWLNSAVNKKNDRSF